jgi:hypothetical protein
VWQVQAGELCVKAVPPDLNGDGADCPVAAVFGESASRKNPILRSSFSPSKDLLGGATARGLDATRKLAMHTLAAMTGARKLLLASKRSSCEMPLTAVPIIKDDTRRRVQPCLSMEYLICLSLDLFAKRYGGVTDGPMGMVRDVRVKPAQRKNGRRQRRNSCWTRW